MVFIFIIIAILFILFVLYNKDNKIVTPEKYNENDNNLDNPLKQIPYTYRNRIENFNDNFFNFQNRINNESITDNPVDKINRMDRGRNYDIGMTISDIYDNLTQNRI